MDAEARAALVPVIEAMRKTLAELEALPGGSSDGWPYLCEATLHRAVRAADDWVFELREVRDRVRAGMRRRRTDVVDVAACVRAADPGSADRAG